VQHWYVPSTALHASLFSAANASDALQPFTRLPAIGKDWKPLGGSTMDLNLAFGAYVASLPGGFGSCGINPNAFSFFSAVVSPPQPFSKRQYQSRNTHLSDLFRSMSTQHNSAWNEWVWHEQHKQWGRYRLSKGEYEYEWRGPEPSTSSTSKSEEQKQLWEINDVILNNNYSSQNTAYGPYYSLMTSRVDLPAGFYESER